MLFDNPYAEWYLNSMQLKGSPTWNHQRETYGPDATYDDFREAFNRDSRDADLDALASLIESSGARYAVLTTKHHDGFTLWPATTPHPKKGRYHAERDLVADVCAALRARDLRAGLYYSGGYDWPYNDAVLSNPADAMLAVPSDSSYVQYATAHVRELIDRFQPSVLWNDICWPAGGNLAELFAHYYNNVPDGVINDRWLQAPGHRGAVGDTLARGAGTVIQALWRFIPESQKSLTFPAAHHYDFSTPEYASFDEIKERKWESTRGVGHSFGANRNERPQDIVTATELIRSFCDIVSKNGNLLIGIGPKPDGTIPEEQQVPLRGLGEWMKRNGAAIYGTRPWLTAQTTTSEKTEVRFTSGAEGVHALMLGLPGRRDFTIQGITTNQAPEVRLLGCDAHVEASLSATGIEIVLPERVPAQDVHALALGPDVRPLGAG
jgi:alpha-L-fucosidase